MKIHLEDRCSCVYLNAIKRVLMDPKKICQNDASHCFTTSIWSSLSSSVAGWLPISWGIQVSLSLGQFSIALQACRVSSTDTTRDQTPMARVPTIHQTCIILHPLMEDGVTVVVTLVISFHMSCLRSQRVIDDWQWLPMAALFSMFTQVHSKPEWESFFGAAVLPNLVRFELVAWCSLKCSLRLCSSLFHIYSLSVLHGVCRCFMSKTDPQKC